MSAAGGIVSAAGAASSGENPRGRTTISARALQRLTAGVAKDAARVSSGDVTVSLADDAGALRVAVAVPVAVTSPAATIPDQSARLRTGIIAGLEDLAGRRVSAVDIRFTGIQQSAERRVI